MGRFEYQAEVQGLTTSVVHFSDPKCTFTISSLSLIQFQNESEIKIESKSSFVGDIAPSHRYSRTFLIVMVSTETI